jgi:hypothetical protein
MSIMKPHKIPGSKGAILTGSDSLTKNIEAICKSVSGETYESDN